MTEVEVTLRFNNHCLGDCRFGSISAFLRDPDGRVMLLATWWASLMRYAAKVANRHHKTVKDIDWDPVVQGESREYRRYYKARRFRLHEAFYPGDEIVVHAVLPDGLTLDDFRELLSIAGRYRGISPFGSDRKYGTFDVRAVTPKRRYG